MVAIHILGKGRPHNGSKGEEHMTKEEVIDLAEQIGLLHDGDWWFSNDRDYSDVHTNDLVALINAAIKKQFSIT